MRQYVLYPWTILNTEKERKEEKKRENGYVRHVEIAESSELRKILPRTDGTAVRT